MAFNKCNKLAKPLIRVLMRILTRPSKLKKYSHLILTPSIPIAKKARPRAVPQPPAPVSPLLRPVMLPFTLLLLVSAQPLVDIDVEDNNEEKGKIEDNNTEELEPPLPPAVVYFISV